MNAKYGIIVNNMEGLETITSQEQYDEYLIYIDELNIMLLSHPNDGLLTQVSNAVKGKIKEWDNK